MFKIPNPYKAYSKTLSKWLHQRNKQSRESSGSWMRSDALPLLEKGKFLGFVKGVWVAVICVFVVLMAKQGFAGFQAD